MVVAITADFSAGISIVPFQPRSRAALDSGDNAVDPGGHPLWLCLVLMPVLCHLPGCSLLPGAARPPELPALMNGSCGEAVTVTGPGAPSPPPRQLEIRSFICIYMVSLCSL
jgi:hypothetical protein